MQNAMHTSLTGEQLENRPADWLLNLPFHWTAIRYDPKFWSNDTNRSRNDKSAVIVAQEIR